MTDALALIPIDLARSPLGFPSLASHRLAGQSVLAWTLNRLTRVSRLKGIVLIHPQGQQPLSLLDGVSLKLPVHTYETASDHLADPFTAMRLSARKVAPASWRGGLGSTTCYDELLCAKPMFEAMQAHHADSALIVGPDWLLMDPLLSSQVLALHLDNPESMQLTFSQAAPGLTGIAISQSLLAQFVDSPVHIGQLLAYSPQRPQADPIGKDVCLQIPPAVRDCPYRVIYDLPRSVAQLDQLLDHWGPDAFAHADGVEVAQTLATLAGEAPQLAMRPITLELTPQRTANGPITPQHHVAFDRPMLSLDDAQTILHQLGDGRDVMLTLGGLGDALLHPQWQAIVHAAKEAGVWGIAIDTDLLVTQAELEKLLDSPIDVIHVRLNADTSVTYRQVMNPDVSDDRFKQVIENLQWLLNKRNSRWQQPDTYPHARAGVPWIVPSLIKTADTLRDMETFFDRWMVYTSHAIITSPQTGCGQMPDQALVNMAPPRRKACRQLARRLTILSDGSLAQCDQDWLGQASAGQVIEQSLPLLLPTLEARRSLHLQSRWDELPLCNACDQWHRP